MEDAFYVHLLDKKIRFKRLPNGLYAMNPEEEDYQLKAENEIQILTTLEENKKFFTPREFERAKRAQDFYHALGTPSIQDLKAMIRMNLIRNNVITNEDIDLAEKIFGPRVDKADLEYNKTQIVLFIPEAVSMIQDQSRRDLRYNGMMKEAVRSFNFYASVQKILSRHENDLPTFFSLQFPFSASNHGVPSGSILAAGEHCINYLADEDDLDHHSINDCKRYLMQNRWVRTYKDIVKNPSAACKDLDFPDIVDWCKTFHILRPIDPSSSEQTKVAVTEMHSMLGIVCHSCAGSQHYCSPRTHNPSGRKISGPHKKHHQKGSP